MHATITDTTSVKLAASFGKGSTFTIPYPAGRDFYDYQGRNTHSLSAQGIPVMQMFDGDFGLTYGASTITVSILIDRTLVAGETVYLHIVRGTDSDIEFDGRQTIAFFGAKVDGTTDDGAAIQASIARQGRAILPLGVTYLNDTITAENDAEAWGGMEGMGHASVLRLGADARIKIQNRQPGGALGFTQWTAQGLKDLTIDGQDLAPYGVILGTDTDAGETSVDLSANGTHHQRVHIRNTEVAWGGGFLTTAQWDSCSARYNDYGWRFRTLTNASASDMWLLNSCAAMSNSMAGVAAVSASFNGVKGSMSGGTIQLNTGWGFYAEGRLGARDVYKLTGVHFEQNGSTARTPRDPITIDGSLLTMEPGHIYARYATVMLDACAFYDGFIAAGEGAILDFRGCQFYTSFDGANYMPPFRDMSADSEVIMSGSIFVNPRVDTRATFYWSGPCEIRGTANDSAFIATRLPQRVIDSEVGLSADPRFASGVGAFTASAGVNPPTVSQQSGAGRFSGAALRAAFAEVIGAENDNALRFNGVIGTLSARNYLATTFFAKSDIATTINVVALSATDGNNMGTAQVEMPAGVWIRVGIVWRERTNADVSSVALSLYPQSDDGPTVDFDCFEVARGPNWRNIEHLLQGAVGRP